MSTLCHQVLKESGPPHMKSFLTRVTVGEFSAEGEGNSKKLSKKRAALSILQDLKKLPFIPAVEKPKTHYKKRTKTILKVLQPGPGPGPQNAHTLLTPWGHLCSRCRYHNTVPPCTAEIFSTSVSTFKQICEIWYCEFFSPPTNFLCNFTCLCILCIYLVNLICLSLFPVLLSVKLRRLPAILKMQ